MQERLNDPRRDDRTKAKSLRLLAASAAYDLEAKQLVIELINSIGLVVVDLGSLVTGGSMHEVGAPLSGLDLHFVRRLR